jgi:cytochrome P450
MGEALGETLFLAEDDDWLARRRVVAPVFGRAHVDAITRTVAAALSAELSLWEPGLANDVQARLTELTIRVACRALLGVDPDNDALGVAVRAHFEVVLGWMAHRFGHLAAPPAWVPTSRNRQMRAARAALRAVVQELVARRRASRGESFDVLSLMVEADRPDDDVVSDCIGFLFAGHETTAATLTWALYELATHPEAQEHVVREGQTLDLDRQDLYTATEELAFTGRVVDEVLRLYPAGIGIARVARCSTSLGAHRVRRGTIVLIAVYLIQRSSTWPDPHEFDPRREFPTSPSEASHTAYLPFGLGPRRCLGARFAIAESRLALAMICARWRLTYEEPHPPQAAVIPSLRVAGALPIRLTARRQTSTSAEGS